MTEEQLLNNIWVYEQEMMQALTSEQYDEFSSLRAQAIEQLIRLREKKQGDDIAS